MQKNMLLRNQMNVWRGWRKLKKTLSKALTKMIIKAKNQKNRTDPQSDKTVAVIQKNIELLNNMEEENGMRRQQVRRNNNKLPRNSSRNH